MVRPVSGKAGQAIVNEASKSAMKASITGPMLPSSVESNVEQYLKKNLSVPTAFNQAECLQRLADSFSYRYCTRL